MPHDKNGQLLEVGDMVLIRCTVSEVYATHEFCNVQVRPVEPMYPSNRHDAITLNAKQVEKA